MGKLVTGHFPQPVLEARGLSILRDGRPLLREVDLSIRPGSFTAIMGPNGSGKSLLLRVLHGLVAPDTGSLTRGGRPVDRRVRAGQAMVFQKPVLLRRSVSANLSFALAVRGICGRERKTRVAAALAAGRLTDLARRPARVLSGGEQQRLAVARALAAMPDLLFLDEPTASLDPASTALIEDQLLAAHKSGVAIVFVTHDRGQARRLAQSIVFLQNGRVVERGPARRVLDAPRSDPARAWLDGRLYFDPFVD